MTRESVKTAADAVMLLLEVTEPAKTPEGSRENAVEALDALATLLDEQEDRREARRSSRRGRSRARTGEAEASQARVDAIEMKLFDLDAKLDKVTSFLESMQKGTEAPAAAGTASPD